MHWGPHPVISAYAIQDVETRQSLDANEDPKGDALQQPIVGVMVMVSHVNDWQNTSNAVFLMSVAVALLEYCP